MKAAHAALALLPIVIGGNRPGREIEHPMAVVILGGLATSTVLNLFVLPALYLRFGRRPQCAPSVVGQALSPAKSQARWPASPDSGIRHRRAMEFSAHCVLF